MSRMTRRRFFQYGAAGGSRCPSSVAPRCTGAGRFPGGTLDPATIPKYELPLVIPPVMPPNADERAPERRRANLDYYEIAVRQFRQQILPSGMPKTTVWGHGSVNHPGTFNYPAFTVEAKTDRAVRVKWINGLVDAERRLPAAPAAGRRDAALGESARRRGRSGQPPVVRVDARRLHRAGADGHPPARRPQHARRATATPRPGICLPRGTSRRGSRRSAPTTTTSGPSSRTRWHQRWEPGTAVFQYENDQPALDAVVPRPRAGDDPRQRLRRAGRLLPAPRRAWPTARRACCRGRLRSSATLRGRAITRSRSSSRTARSTPTARCSTRPAASSSTASPGRTSRTATSRRSSTRSTSATRSSSTAGRGPSSRWSRAATASGS